MAISYDEIMIKYVDGGLLKGISFILQNLTKDPEVIAGTSREKEALLKFLTNINDQFDDFISDGEDGRNQQDDKELFGDDDIVVGPDVGTQTTFMDPPEPGDDSHDDEDTDDFGFENGFDDGFPK